MSENTADRDGSECTIGERLRYAASPDQNGWRVQLSPLMLEADAEITRLSTALAAAEANKAELIRLHDEAVTQWQRALGQITPLTAQLQNSEARVRELENDAKRWEESRDWFAQETIDLKARVTVLREAVEKALPHLKRRVCSNSFGQRYCWLCEASAECGHYLEHKSDCLLVTLLSHSHNRP